MLLTRLRFVQTKGISCNRLSGPLERSGKDDIEYDTKQYRVNGLLKEKSAVAQQIAVYSLHELIK